MTKIVVRQVILGCLVILNGLLLAASVYWLRNEATAAVLFLFFFAGALVTFLFSGLYVTAGSRDTAPYRMVMGYLLWASYRSARFYTNTLWLVLLLASVWLVGPHAIYRLQANCEGAPVVMASSFLGREIRVPCQSRRATVQVYQPFRTIDVAKDRVSCIDGNGTVYPALSQAGPVVACNTPPSQQPLRVERMEPAVIEANHIRRYRLFGSGFTKDVSVSLDAASFVGSSLSRDPDRHPAEVDPGGQWVDVFISVMYVPGRDRVTIKLTNEHNQATEFAAPVQVSALR
jgi:hypothetical protein